MSEIERCKWSREMSRQYLESQWSVRLMDMTFSVMQIVSALLQSCCPTHLHLPNLPGSMWTWVYMKRSGQLLLASCVHFCPLAIHLFTPHCPCMLLSGKNSQDIYLFFFFFQHTFFFKDYRSLIWGKMGRNDRIVFCVVRWSTSLFVSLRFLNLTPSTLFIQIRPPVICHCKSYTSFFLAIFKKGTEEISAILCLAVKGQFV